MSEDLEEKAAAVPAGEQSAELSQAVYEALVNCVPEEKREKKLGTKGTRLLKIDEADARENRKGYRGTLYEAISDAYPKVGREYLTPATNAAVTKMEEILRRERSLKPDPVVMDRLASAFKEKYVGDADQKFQQYLERCCSAYRENPGSYTSPYVAISQSSGFGKSRLLYNLAEQASSGVTECAEGTTFSMRILYVCARSGDFSSGFPVATPMLKEWFFQKTYPEKTDPEKRIASRLVQAFRCARSDWQTAGSQWPGLFIEESADAAVVDKLNAFGNKQGPQKKLDIGNVTLVLVFAVDEARALLETGNKNGISFFRLLRRALILANQNVEGDGIIFGVLVDTNSKIHDFVPPWSTDPSSRRDGVQNTAFPPFVLTHTNDVLLGGQNSSKSFDYEASVTTDDEAAKWKTLVSMGRPLWARCGKGSKQQLINFAASKLLLGKDITSVDSYNSETLHGVASMFCRLGLRPHSASVYASRMVADFMAVLHYVNHTNEAQITSYAPEPVLALGATRLWRQLDPPAFERFILPQFEEMLVQGVVDTGGVGEIVARIFLLLAMDMTVEQTFTAAGGATLVLEGQFCPVPAFLKLLYGPCPRFYDAKMQGLFKPADADIHRVKFGEWIAGWKDWKVGFCQFVELPNKPTKKTLWFLLGRRAAAVLPRNQAGADLLIPIFCGHDVSFVLVQVKNIFGNDKEFPATASTKLTAAKVFEKHELSGTSPSDMIRLYMNLQACYTTNKPQCILVDKADVKHPGDETYSVVLRGMCRPAKQRLDENPSIPELWPFLTPDVASQLESIVNSPWWDATYEVNMDLRRRSKAKNAKALEDVMTKEELFQVAEHALVAMPF